ncbi:MAG: hypothetical protein VX425_07880, partial [Pseudomonadota bacterium]|nr:hypothetical protein [Pseudomonadota bacterium]
MADGDCQRGAIPEGCHVYSFCPARPDGPRRRRRVGASALAADGLDTGDTAWILSATALVLFMTLPGLALFYAGLVQSKNIISVLMHHFAIACLMSVLWVV